MINKTVGNCGLKGKFSIIIIVIFLPAFLAVSFFQYRQIYISHADFEIEKMRLLAHICSSFYHGSSILNKILEENPAVIIRYASLIPRNLKNQADYFEQTVIKLFEQKMEQQEYIGMDYIHGQKAIRYLKPLWSEKSCQECHFNQVETTATGRPNFKPDLQTEPKISGVLSIAVPASSFSLALWEKWLPSLFLNIILLLAMILIWLIFAKLYITDQLEKISAAMLNLAQKNGLKEEIVKLSIINEIDRLSSIFTLINSVVSQKIQDLNKEIDLYQTVTHSKDYGILGLDAEEKIILFNEGAERIFGWKREEILGQKISLLSPHDVRRKHIQSIEEHHGELENFMLEEFLETSGLHKSGQEIPLTLSVSTGKADGQLIFTAIIQDTSAQKLKEGEIIRENQKLLLLNKISTELLMQRDLKKLAEYSLDKGLDLTDSFCGFFLLQNKDGDLVALDMVGLPKSDDDNTTQVFKTNGVLGEIVRQKEPCIINTTARKDNRTMLSFGKFSFHSFLGVPIISDQEVIGIMCVANRINAYTEKEVKLLTTLAEDISLLIIRNAIEKEIKVLEEKFRTLFDQSSDMMVICNREGKILTVNHRVIQYTGFSYQEVIEHSILMLFLPGQETGSKEFLKQVWKKGFSRFESILRQKNGGSFHVDVQANTVILSEEKIIQIVIRDIVHFKQIETKLKTHVQNLMKKLEAWQKENLFLLRAINTWPEYVIFTDQRGRIFFANEAAGQRLGYPIQDLAGRSFEFLFHPTMSVETIDEIMRQALGGTWKGRVVSIDYQKLPVEIELYLKAVHDQQGGLLGLFAMFKEIIKLADNIKDE